MMHWLLTFSTVASGFLSPSAARSPSAVPVVDADAETVPLQKQGDAADDPAIWVHPIDPARSLIIGTDKKAGLVVYDLAGAIVQSLPDGRMNNVDVVQGVAGVGGQTFDLVVASNRDTDTIAAYFVDPASGRLAAVGGEPIPAGVKGVYGLCAYVEPASRRCRVVTNSKDGTLVITELFQDDSGLSHSVVRSLCVGTQVEGCVVDVARQLLYVGEEAVGVWSYPLEPSALDEHAPGRVLLDGVNAGAGNKLARDVEGVTLYEGEGTAGWLIVSCQGEDRYAVYERGSGKYVGSFAVRFKRSDGTIDPVTHTDGIAAISRPLGPRFPRGIFVAQDDNGGSGQNFKIVNWRTIEQALGLKTTEQSADR